MGKRNSGNAKKSNASIGDNDYVRQRKKNNDAVLRSRQKARQEELETADRVQLLQQENEELENRVTLLNRELAMLKQMFVEFASGKRGKRSLTKTEVCLSY